MFRPLVAVVVVPSLAAGCADRAAPLRREIADLRQKLEAAAQEKADANARIDDLANQVMILQDKLELATATGQRAPEPARAPVVRVEPKPEAAPEPRLPAATGEEDVEYAGEARDTRSPRPVLRIEGGLARRALAPPDAVVELPEGRPARAGRAGPRRSAPAVATGERLPVVPLPDDGVPTRPSSQPAARPAAPRVSPAAAGAAATAYGRALEALRRKAHGEAIAALREFGATWPRHELAQNAQYWLGEAYYDQGDYRTALEEFRRVVQRYPSGAKAPDALLKAGYCHAKLGDTKNARNLLGQVVELYPKSTAARLAEGRLRVLR